MGWMWDLDYLSMWTLRRLTVSCDLSHGRISGRVTEIMSAHRRRITAAKYADWRTGDASWEFTENC